MPSPEHSETEPNPVTPPGLIFSEMIPAEAQAILRGVARHITDERADDSFDAYIADPVTIDRTAESDPTASETIDSDVLHTEEHGTSTLAESETEQTRARLRRWRRLIHRPKAAA